ncbi:MAG: exo-alpha-sialidase [Gemmatimonadetes bacterium]|nr:exo-alpha-sialidase [Gemmatimonadota bacterium]
MLTPRQHHRWPLGLLLLVVTSCRESTSGDTTLDPCGNALGNGAQVIGGPAGPQGSDSDRAFSSLVVAPGNADELYIGTERNGIVRSRDGGRTWERLRAGMRHGGTGYPEVYDLAIAPGSGTVLMAATTDSPGPLTGDHPSTIAGVYRSTDAGGNWTRINCGLPSASASAVTMLDASGSTALVAISAGTATFSPLSGTVFPGGIYRTSNGGGQWQAVQSSTLLSTSQFTVIRRVADTGELLIYALNRTAPQSSVGFLRSTDAGASWSTLANPLGGRTVTHFDVSRDGGVIWANTAEGFRIWRSVDAGTTWVETGGMISNGAVAVSPRDANVVLVDDFGTLRHSTDGLATTRVVVSSTQPFEDIAFAPTDANIVYGVTRGYDVYRSPDGGRSFVRVANLRDVALR